MSRNKKRSKDPAAEIRRKPKAERVAMFRANPVIDDCSDEMFFTLLEEYGLDLDDVADDRVMEGGLQ